MKYTKASSAQRLSIALYIRNTQPSCEAASYTVKKLVTVTNTISNHIDPNFIISRMQSKFKKYHEKYLYNIQLSFNPDLYKPELTELGALTEFIESVEAPLDITQVELHTDHAAGAVVAVVRVGRAVVVGDHQVGLRHVTVTTTIYFSFYR